jgi:hypothetical protein
MTPFPSIERWRLPRMACERTRQAVLPAGRRGNESGVFWVGRRQATTTISAVIFPTGPGVVEAPGLGARVPVGDAARELPAGDGLGGVFDLDERAQAGADDHDRDADQDQQHPAADDQVDGPQPPDRAVDVVEHPGDHQGPAGAVGDGLDQDTPATPAAGGVDGEGRTGLRLEVGVVVVQPRELLVLAQRDAVVAQRLAVGVADLHQERARQANVAAGLRRRGQRPAQRQAAEVGGGHGGQLVVQPADQRAAQYRDADHADHGQGDGQQRHHRERSA